MSMSSAKFTLNLTLSCPIKVSAMAAHDEDIQLRAEDDEFAGDIADDALDTLKSRVITKKGRGFEAAGGGHQGDYESIDHTGDGPGPMRSVEGWIVFVSNLHEEAQEEDIHDKFADYGEIKNIHVNLDRRTGYLKGYALIEYETYREANLAIQKFNGGSLLGKKVEVDWAFVKPRERGGRRGGKW